MSRFVQVQVSNEVSDRDIEYLMEMLKIIGTWVSKDLTPQQDARVIVSYTSL